MLKKFFCLMVGVLIISGFNLGCDPQSPQQGQPGQSPYEQQQQEKPGPDFGDYEKHQNQ